jgi:hypothetical protein
VGPSGIAMTASREFQTALHDQANDWDGEWIGGFTLLRSSFIIPDSMTSQDRDSDSPIPPPPPSSLSLTGVNGDAFFEQHVHVHSLIPAELARVATIAPVAEKAIKYATLFATGVGCFSIRINGHRVSNSFLDPGFSTVPSVRLLYRAFDATSLVSLGSNDIQVSLGMCKYGYLDNTGIGLFCKGATGLAANCRAALIQLNIVYTDGTTYSHFSKSGSAGSWFGTTELNPSRYDHLFHGVVYNATLEQVADDAYSSCVHQGNCVEGTWQTAEPYNFTSNDQAGLGELNLHTMPAIEIDKEYTAIAIHNVTGSDGLPAYVFDFGENIAGFTRLQLTKYQLPTNTTLFLRHAELAITNSTYVILNVYCDYPCPTTCGQADGGNCANQTDAYTIRGVADETWFPDHTYHGFRYVQLEGWPITQPAPDISVLTALFVHSMVEQTGSVKFNSSLDILNQIQDSIVVTQLSNLHSIPTDCPQREKRGWMGDGQWTAGETSLNFDATSLYMNWLRSMDDSQVMGCTQASAAEIDSEGNTRPVSYECCSVSVPTFGCDFTGTNFTDMTGGLPDVVPYEKKGYGAWPGDPSWIAAAAVVPWEMYVRTSQGDSAIRMFYRTAKNLVDFLTNHIDPDVGLVQYGGYGDWVAPQPMPKGQVS